MAEGYLANNKKTPQGVTNVEVILFNYLMQERWKITNRAMERANRAMERANRAMERILIPLKWQTKGSTTYGLLP
jgi:ribosomal protein L16/L10AE